MHISRLKPVPLRELWPHEARDLTPWLADNLDLLGEALGIELSLIEREAAAGIFSADVLAEDGHGDHVVIENQLDRTDHDHLGKLVTYLSNLDAKTAIWVTPDPRPEHEQAIHWLNEVLPADTAFYLVLLEAFRIGDSPPAPKLTVVAGPTAEGRQAGEKKKELAERHVLRLKFWTQLLDRAQERTQRHANVSPGKENWINAGAGRTGLSYLYTVRMNDTQVDLTIDDGDAESNKRRFDALHAARERVEKAFGGPLEWQRLDEVRLCKVRYVLPDGGLLDEERWPDIQDQMVDAMVRLEKAFAPEIEGLE